MMRDLPAREFPRQEPLWKNIRFGLHYVWQGPTMLALLWLTSAYGMFAFPQLQLLPVFARDVLGIGAKGLGWMLSCFGIGGVLSSLSLAMLGDIRGRGHLYIASASALGLLLVFLGLSRSPALSFPLMLLIGVGHVQTMVNNNTMLQRLMPAELRGRLTALYFMAFQGTLPLGNLLAGSLAEHLGAPQAVMLLGLIFSACVIVTAFRLPRLRQAF